jgi:hypothetical protein
MRRPKQLHAELFGLLLEAVLPRRAHDAASLAREEGDVLGEIPVAEPIEGERPERSYTSAS